MEVDTVSKKNAREKTIARLYELLELQEKVEKRFGIDRYNVFVFGSYVTIHYVEGQSDIDIAIYTEDFDLYKRISMYLEEYFAEKGIESDIFYDRPNDGGACLLRAFKVGVTIYRLLS